MTGTGSLRWFKSSYSDGGGGACVEAAIALDAHAIHIRDSKNPDGPNLTASGKAWAAFIAPGFGAEG
jgi:uncharacterized protein DUF397